MRRLVLIAIVLALGACAKLPEPSVSVRAVEAKDNGHVRITFSTDQLSQAEAQETLLLAAALLSEERDARFFQFRKVIAKAQADQLSERFRYIDFDATVHPLTGDETGDAARKTYRTEGVIDFLGPKYRPILPDRLTVNSTQQESS